jgi:hypothetical protein
MSILDSMFIVTQPPNFMRLANNKLTLEAHSLYKIDYPADQYLGRQKTRAKSS